MSNLNNIVILTGNAGGTPEMRKAGKTDVATFQIATNDPRKDKDGKWVQHTEWHRVEAWGALAKIAEKHVKAGTECKIFGKLEYGSYEKEVKVGKQTTKVKMYTTVIRIEKIDTDNRRVNSNEEE